MIADNLSSVKRRISEASRRVGRDPESVRLVVVSKRTPQDRVLSAYQAGARCFGESKIQEAVSKMDETGLEDADWHFIGHLQKNKIKYLNSRFGLVHSVDSLPLAEKMSEYFISQGRVQPVLLQVNISGEEAKFGMSPSELQDRLSAFAPLKGIAVKGLMTIPPQDRNSENSRPCFSALRELRDKCRGLNIEGIDLKELSMGMTNDYPVAIEEGATLVRVGAAVFGERSLE